MKQALMGAALAVCMVLGAQSASAGPVSICDAVAGNLVSNCGFETADFTSWTQFGNTGATSVDGSANSGGFGTSFGPVGSTGGILQNIVTNNTDTYSLSFYLGNDGGTPSSFDVSWGGASLYSEANAGSYGYTLFQFNMTGQNASTELRFTFRQDPAYYHLDDVVVQDTSTAPEPGTAGLLLAGFGALGWLARRRAV